MAGKRLCDSLEAMVPSQMRAEKNPRGMSLTRGLYLSDDSLNLRRARIGRSGTAEENVIDKFTHIDTVGESVVIEITACYRAQRILGVRTGEEDNVNDRAEIN